MEDAVYDLHSFVPHQLDALRWPFQGSASLVELIFVVAAPHRAAADPATTVVRPPADMLSQPPRRHAAAGDIPTYRHWAPLILRLSPLLQRSELDMELQGRNIYFVCRK